MTLAGGAMTLSGAGVPTTATPAALLLRDTLAALNPMTHRADRLPQVVANRYAMMLLPTPGCVA